MELSFLYVVSTIFVAMIVGFTLRSVLQYVIKFQSFILHFAGKKVGVSESEIGDKDEENKDGDNLRGDLEVVAVIVAALSSYLDTPQSNLSIKSIKRVNSNCK